MIDIVSFNKAEAEEFNKACSLNFSKIYHANNFRIATGGNEGLNRKIVENKSTDILLDPEPKGKDALHYRHSGLNQVICKLANKNKVAIAFSFSRILKADEKERIRLFGKIMQNIRFCRKYKVKMILASFALDKYEMRNAQDLRSFALVIGMTPKEAKEALDFKPGKDFGIRLLKEEDNPP